MSQPTTEQLLATAAMHLRNQEAELERLRPLAKAAALAAPAPASTQLPEHDGLVKSTRLPYATTTEAPVPSAFTKGIANHRAQHATRSADDVVSSDGFASGAMSLDIEVAQVREGMAKDAGAPVDMDDAKIRKALIRRHRHQGLQRGAGSGDLS